MHKNNDDSNGSPPETSVACCISLRKPSITKPTQSIDPVKRPKRSEIERIADESPNKVSPSSSQVRFLSRSSNQKVKAHIKGIQLNEGKVYPTPEYVVSDCWDSNKTDGPMKIVELFKENNAEEDDLDVPIKKRRLQADGEDDKSPPYTREFHMLTEIQKSRILTAVEDTIKKLAGDDIYHGPLKVDRSSLQQGYERANSERIVCKKFLLPWVLMKITEMIVCHIIQFTFLSDPSYLQKKDEFLPIVVTFYVTLFIIVISLLVHISCFSYAGVQNPCYFMGVVSSSIVSLTTTMGMLIMLITMDYYKTYRQILVLVFICVLAVLLFVELYLFYVEVKSIWKVEATMDQDYVT